MDTRSNTFHVKASVARWGIGLGVSSLVGGVALFSAQSDSNLAPLGGILVTGPLGALLGAEIGVLRSARATRENPREAAAVLVGLTVFGLALSSFFIRIGMRTIALFTVSLMLVGVVAFYAALGNRRWLPAGACHMVAMSMLVATTVILPVRRPRFGPWAHQALTTWVASFGDPRLDASRSFPELEVNRSALLIEWLVIGGIGLWLGRRNWPKDASDAR